MFLTADRRDVHLLSNAIVPSVIDDDIKRAVVQMAASNEDWSRVSQDIIDVFVEHLKRTKRWSRDGRSLRALNKHWCMAVNAYIVEVHPYSSRVIHEGDIDSLSKFQNLTTLNTVPFEEQDIARKQDRCLRLAKVLSKLSHLKRLHVKDFLKHTDECTVQSLSSIEEIEIERSRCIDHNVLSKISGWNLREIAGRFSIAALNDFLPQMSSLKILLMDKQYSGSKEQFYDCIPKTNTLDSVSMTIQADRVDMKMSQMHRLVALTIIDGIPESFDPLAGLHKLTSLDFSIRNGAILTGAGFRQISERLMSLTVRSHRTSQLPNDFLGEAKVLKVLSLYGGQIEKRLMDHLERLSLKSLSLVGCDYLDALFFLQAFSSLTQLTVKGSWAIDIVWPSSPLRCLTALTVGLKVDDYSEFIDKVCYLTSLESLEIEYVWYESDADLGIDKLEGLPNLRSLKLYGLSLSQFKTAAELKMMTGLEELTLGGGDMVSGFLDAARCIEVIKENAPYLKVDNKSI